MLKNSEIIELTKFFLMDSDSSKVQFSLEAHELMNINIEYFKSVYLQHARLEQSIVDLKKSDEYTEFLSELESLIKDDHLVKKPDGTLERTKEGIVPILPGHDDDVTEAYSKLSTAQKYENLFKQIRFLEEKLKKSLSSQTDMEISFIDPCEINLDSLKLNRSQWEVLKLILKSDTK